MKISFFAKTTIVYVRPPDQGFSTLGVEKQGGLHERKVSERERQCVTEW